MKLFMTALTSGQRKDFFKLDKERREVSIQEGIEVTSDIAYMDDNNPEHRYDKYMPAGGGALPIVINFHGGGLLTGSKEFNKCFCADIANEGFAVYSIEYSKLPQNRLEDIISECIMAVNHIMTHATAVENDRKVYVTGDSGGGFLALFCTAVLREPYLCSWLKLRLSEEDVITYARPECKPVAMALISPLVYTAGKGTVRSFYSLMLYKGSFVSSGTFAYPEDSRIVDALPRSLFVSSLGDNLLTDSMQYVEYLKSQGKYAEFEYFDDPNLKHDFALFNPELEESKMVVQLIARCLAT